MFLDLIMNYVSVLLPLALILVISKVLGILCKKVGLPQVVGYLVAGLLLGLINYIPNQIVFTPEANEGLGFIAKLGVILIMFSAGLCSDLKQIRKMGIKSILITLAGVIVPMGLGFILSVCFNGGFENIANNYLESLGYGCILTATSVSVTVATLKELGKLNTPMGTCIVSAAILDDIIGVIVLSVVLGLGGTQTVGNVQPYFIQLLSLSNMSLAACSAISVIIYFVIFITGGIFLGKGMNYLAKKYDHHRRIPIYSLAICFIFAWCAEMVFGVADITGAFLAGILLSTNYDKTYIDEKAESFSNLIFTPVFFANIGITISFSSIDGQYVAFGMLFVLMGIIGKFVGCGGTAKACGFSWKDSSSIGVGMMVRAEVALVCADKLKGIVSPNITTFVVILILITSLLAPILLKLLNKNKKIAPPTDASPEITSDADNVSNSQ